MTMCETLAKSPGQGRKGLQPEFTGVAVFLCCSYCVSLLDGCLFYGWVLLN